jgi:hypothetical protein
VKYLVSIISALVLTPVALADSIVSESEQDGVRATVRIDRLSAQVVEPIRLTVTITTPRGSTVLFPELPQELGPFRVRDVETVADLPTTSTALTRESIMRIDLETLRTGLQTIPPLQIEYRLAGTATETAVPSETQSIQTEPIDVRIASLLEDRADLTDFRDIKPVVEFDLSEPPSRSGLWWSVAASALAALLIAGALLILSSRRGMTAADSALAQIGQLESQIDQIDAETLYDQLALIVDRFLQLQFTVPGNPNEAEQDLLVPAERLYPTAVRESLARFKSMSEDVRFARLTPGPDQIQSVFDQARTVIRTGESTTSSATLGVA